MAQRIATGQAGLTLYISGEGAKPFLISMDGEVRQTWETPFSTVWDDTAAARDQVLASHTYFNKANVFPNGDLLVIYTGAGDSPYGYGMRCASPRHVALIVDAVPSAFPSLRERAAAGTTIKRGDSGPLEGPASPLGGSAARMDPHGNAW